MIKYIFFVVVFFSFVFGVQSADAFSIKPSKIFLTLNPGDKKDLVIQITNTEKKELNFIGKIYSVRQNNDGTPQFLTGFDQSEQWVRSVSGVNIKSGESGNIGFEINIPNKSRPGSYFIGLAIQPNVSGINTVGLNSQIVSLLKLQVAGVANEKLEVTKWKFDQANSKSGSWQFELDINNKSNVDVPVSGWVTVMKNSSYPVYKQDLVLGNMLLADTLRFLKPELRFTPAWLIPTTYKVEVAINYGISKQTVRQVEKVIIIPRKFVYFLIGLIVILLVAPFLYFKRRKTFISDK